MDYKYKYKKYKNKIKNLKGGFINLDKLNMLLAPSDKKEKLKNDIKKKEKEIEERKKEIINLEDNENVEKSKEQDESQNLINAQILEELKDLNLYIKSTDEERKINKKLNSKEIKNKVRNEIDFIAKNVKDEKISYEKGKEKTINLLGNIVDDVKTKTQEIVEDLNEKKKIKDLSEKINDLSDNKIIKDLSDKIEDLNKNDKKISNDLNLKIDNLDKKDNKIIKDLNTKIDNLNKNDTNKIEDLERKMDVLNNRAFTPITKKVPYLVPINMPYVNHRLSYPKVNYQFTPNNFKVLSSGINQKNLKPLQLNNFYTKLEEQNKLNNLLTNKNQDDLGNVESIQISNNKNFQESKDIEDEKLDNFDLLNDDKKVNNLEILNDEKKFNFSKIYKNTYLFAMILILANFI